MNVVIIIIIIAIVSSTLARCIPNSGLLNVGTVLFAPSALNKTHWSKASIALLQARKYLQEIIPSPQITGNVNDEFIANLLKYFEKSYKTVKRDTKHQSLRQVMDVALSDALGGYLKVFILPITKYAYYAGTLSLASSFRIFEVYEDIKRSLKTDGSGWHDPNKNLFDSVTINLVTIRPSYSKGIGNPCKQLAFYEKTDEGMKIPLPNINWDISPPTMFLPLVNQSIICLSSPSSSSSLLEYYTIADKCMKSQFSRSDDFYTRFQKWFSNQVMPHLYDDKLYTPFGGILSVMNLSKEFYTDKIDNLNVHLMMNLNSLKSKRFFIVALIFLIELVCSLPIIIYVMWLKRKKRRKSKYRKYNQRHQKCINSMTICKPTKFSAEKNDSLNSKQSNHGLKFFVHPKTTNVEVDMSIPLNDSINNVSLVKSSNTLSETGLSYCDLITIMNEIPIKSSSGLNVSALSTATTVIKKSSTKHSTQSKKTNQETACQEVRTIFEKMQQLKSTKTLTLIQNSEKTMNEINYSQEDTQSLDKFEQNEPTVKRNIFKNKGKTGPRKIIMCSQTDKILEEQKSTMVDADKIRAYCKKESEFRASEQPVLRILIERPQNSITVGITSFKGQTRKPSKIPRAIRSGKDPNDITRRSADSLTVVNESADTSTTKFSNAKHAKHIVIREKATDDSNIKETSVDNLHKKINITL